MQTKIYHSFAVATSHIAQALLDRGYEVSTEKWQGLEKPPAFLELMNVSFQVPMVTADSLKPNQPWADIHFQERIGGLPLNPGESYKQWPFYGQDAKMRSEGDQFSHTYMERMWPRFAGYVGDGDLNYLKKQYESLEVARAYSPLKGIRYEYGDLQSVINLLKNEPNTRQAYLPIWFPEDTGSLHGGRVPCTIGYHFIRRNGHLHCVYQLRSCDFLRHLQDDMYLATRLTDGILALLREDSTQWQQTNLGFLKMDITSLHLFAQEKNRLKQWIG